MDRSSYWRAPSPQRASAARTVTPAPAARSRTAWLTTRPQRKRVLPGLWTIAVLVAVMTGLWMTDAPATGTGSPVKATVPLPPTTTAPSPTTTTTTAPPPPPTTVPASTLPARGDATAWGCSAALAYMRAYADPTFELVCPGDAQGHQAVTCFGEYPCAPGQRMIAIADPCPAAYMNEAHNSWVLDHEATGSAIPDGSAAIDPYGYCH